MMSDSSSMGSWAQSEDEVVELNVEVVMAKEEYEHGERSSGVTSVGGVLLWWRFVATVCSGTTVSSILLVGMTGWLADWLVRALDPPDGSIR